MQTQVFKNVPDFTRLIDQSVFDNAISATRELLEINARLMERCLENQINMANLCVESGEKQLKVNSAITDPQDFTEKQSELYEEYRSKFSEVTGNNIKLAQDAGEEYVGWFKRNMPNKETAKAKAAKAGTKTTSRKAAA